MERMAEINPDLYLVNVGISGSNQIFVEIDNAKGGVAIDDCISVSRNIEHNLDREIEDFSLEVSSAGLDKPFRVYKQYEKNVGKEVQVKKLEHGKSITGILKSVNEEGIVIETKEKQRVEGKKKKIWVEEEIPINFNEIKETKLIISF